MQHDDHIHRNQEMLLLLIFFSQFQQADFIYKLVKSLSQTFQKSLPQSFPSHLEVKMINKYLAVSHKGGGSDSSWSKQWSSLCGVSRCDLSLSTAR